MCITVDDAYSLDDLKLNVHSAIYDAKANNKNSIQWKPLLPTESKTLDNLLGYLVKQDYNVYPTQDNGCILIEWKEK